MGFWTIQSFLGLIKKTLILYFVTHFEFWRYASSHWSWNILNIPRYTRLVWPVFNKRHQLQSIFPHRFYQNCCLRLKPQNLSQFHPRTETQKPKPQKKHINKNIYKPSLNQRICTPNHQPQNQQPIHPGAFFPRRIFSVKFSASSSKNPSSLRFHGFSYPFSPVVVMFWLVGHLWSFTFASRGLLDNYVSSAEKDETLFQWGFSWPSDTLVSKPALCWNQSGFSTVGSKCRPTKFSPNNMNSFCSFQR